MAASSHPPAAPVPARPPRKRLPRWLLLILGAIAFLLLAGWWTQRPLARIPLPDGSELRLVEARYAPEFHFRSIGLRERLLQFLPSRWHTPLDDSEDLDLGDPGDRPTLWLVFEARGGHSHDPKSAETPHLLVSPMDSGEVIASDTDASTFQAPQGPRHVVGITCYPRRARQFQLRIEVQREGREPQFVCPTITNPFPVSDAPHWTAEPVPQTRRLNSRDVVLQRLHIDYGDPDITRSNMTMHCEAEIKVHEPGVPDEAFESEYSLLDPTGNEAEHSLPLSEPVWKIRGSVWANNTYPFFTAAHILSLGQTTMPGPGDYRILPLRDDSTGIARQAILVGRGWYRLDFNKELTVEPIEPPAKNTSWLGPNSRIVECTTSELLVVGWPGPLFQPPPPGFSQMWRLVIGQTVIPLNSTHAADDGVWQGYRATYRGEDIPQGMGVETQSILSPVETVDFFVHPPKR